MAYSSPTSYTTSVQRSRWRRPTVERLKLELNKAVENRLTPRQIFTRYVDVSTLHGINYACYNTALFRRLFWSCCMVAGTIYFVDKLRKGIDEYTAYPFSTLSTQTYVEQLTFPAISLCLVNSYNLSKVENSDFQPSNGKHAMLLDKRAGGTDISGDQLISTLENVSIPIDEVFLKCEWISRDTRDPSVNKTKCGPFNFTNYFNELSQRCYTFNSGQPEHRLLSVDHPGLSYAYELLINTRSNEAVPSFQYGGIKVILHDQSQPPLMSEGFLVSPGFTTYVRMSKKEKKGLPPPYATNCGYKKLKHHAHYSQKACLLELLTEHTGKRCKCRAVFMPDNSLPICSLNQVINCMHPAKESFNIHEMRALCPIECSEVSFDVTLNEGRYKPIRQELESKPASDYVEEGDVIRHKIDLALGEIVLQQHPRNMERYIQNNLVNVVFYYGEMTEEMHEQEGTLDFYQFLGDMGGEIGLMLGASILSFFEILDLIIFLVYNLLLRLHKDDKNDGYDETEINEEDDYGEEVKEFEYSEVMGETKNGKMNNDFFLSDLIFRPYIPWEIEYSYDEFGDRVTTV